MTLQPLCPTLDIPLLSNLLATCDRRGNSPAIDYLLDTLAAATPNDRLADVLLCYATMDGFKEAVLIRYLDAAGQPDYATAVAMAFMKWNAAPGRWVAEDGKLVLADPEGAVLSRKRAVLACFPDVERVETFTGKTFIHTTAFGPLCPHASFDLDGRSFTLGAGGSLTYRKLLDGHEITRTLSPLDFLPPSTPPI